MNKKVYVDLSQQDVQDIINAYEKDIEKFNKQKEILDKIKKWVYHQQQSNENLEPYISTDKLDEILELLEEIK